MGLLPSLFFKQTLVNRLCKKLILLFTANDTDFWTDGVYTPDRGIFYWNKKNTSFSYSNWYKSHQTIPDCAYLDYIDNYFWHPGSCDRTGVKGYICEITDTSQNAGTRPGER